MSFRPLFIFFVSVSVFVLSACSSTNYEEEILGDWECSIFIDAEKAADLFDLDDAEGMQLETTLSGTEEYLRGGRYNSEGDITLRISAEGQEFSLRFHYREAGTYEIHGDHVVSITEDSKYTPLDEMTRNFIGNVPEFADAMAPVKGESSSMVIISMAEGSMQVVMDDLPGMIITYQRL